MPSQNWGDLTKSLADSELVEEAISRLIGVHNNDPEAHLAVGQSLQSHKASEIIDHLAESVVTDKIAKGFFEYFGNIAGWTSLDAFFSAGDTIYLMFDKLNLQANKNHIGYAYVKCKGSAFYSSSPFLEFSFSGSSTGGAPQSYLFYVGIGNGYESEDTPFLGFKFANGVVTAEININLGDVIHSAVIADISPNDYHYYRVEYYAGVGAKFYVDGVLRANLLYFDIDGTSGFLFTARAEAPTVGKLVGCYIGPFTYGLL